MLDREDVGGSEGGLQAVFSVRGTTWHQNTYSMNGVNVTDPAATGATDFYFDYDSFEEVEISTGSHSAEVATPGVYLNVVARVGNRYVPRRRGLLLRERQPRRATTSIRSSWTQGVSRGSSINLFSDFTAQLGGPIIKDKLRFYTSWRDWRIHRNVVNVPISENTDLFSGLGNVTWQVNPRNQITGLYTVQTYLKPNRNVSANGCSSAIDLDRGRRLHHRPGDVDLDHQRQQPSRRPRELFPHQLPAQSAAGSDERRRTSISATGVTSRAADASTTIRPRSGIGCRSMGPGHAFVSDSSGSHDLKVGAEYQTAGDENGFYLDR